MSGPRRVVVEADGGSRGNPGPAGYGAVVRDAETGEVLAERAAGLGRVTNNVAEYAGLIAGLTAAAELAPSGVEVRMDSKLVVEQMSGRWQVKHPAMKPLHAEAKALLRGLPAVRFTWIPRAQNLHADRLANEAMDAAGRGHVWRPGGDTGPADAADTWLAEQAPDPAAASPPARPPSPSMTPTTTLLLRHGQTVLSVQKRFSGTGEQELTEVGRAQAAAVAERLATSGATAVLASPVRRARQTAELVASALGVEVTLEPGLRETDFGAWEGSTFGEVGRGWPDEMAAWLADHEVAPPGGESFAATALRVREALDRVLATYAGQRVVLVSHVTPIKTLLRFALDAPPSALYRMHLDLACLSEVQWFSDGPSVVRSLNDTHHLPVDHR